MSLDKNTAERFQKAVVNYYNKVVEVFNKKRESAMHAKKASKVEGMTRSQYLSAIGSGVDEHIASTDNPHQDTAASVGVYTKAEATSVLSKYVSALSFPITFWGSREQLETLEVKTDGLKVTFPDGVHTVVGGIYTKIPETTIDLNDVSNSPSNQLFFAYVIRSGNTLKYVIESSNSTPRAPDYDTLDIGWLETNASGITENGISASQACNGRPAEYM